MTTSLPNPGKALLLILLAVAIGVMGAYVASADDAPGAAVIGLLLMLGGIVLGVRAARNRLPAWAVRASLIGGALVAAFAAFLTHATVVAAPLFVQPEDVPSVLDSPVAAPWAAAAGRARDLARRALSDQNLPGLSIAVGVGNQIVWAEGFGWRDVETRTPVTPRTRFHIGTAATVVPPDLAASLGLTHTRTDSASDWSPDHTGEPEEDFPLFTLVRHVVLQPIGLVRAQPLPDDRATFFVPRSGTDPRRGRHPMPMRALACCAGTMAMSSTPSDLVRVGLAHGVSADGALAGGTAMSMVAEHDGLAVVVMSNIAHADTAVLATRIRDVFAGEPR